MTFTKGPNLRRFYRHQRIRKALSGTPDRPRLCVYKSLKNFYAQVIDDSTGKVLIGLSTLNKSLKAKLKTGGNVKAAETLGEAFAEHSLKKGIKKVCFDRGGYLYHGTVKAFADAARKGGMDF